MVYAAVPGAELNLQENSIIFSVEVILTEMAALQSFIPARWPSFSLPS
jgi:hypothetical protein